MKPWKLIWFFIGIWCLPNAFAASVTGRWTTVDDKTGNKRAVIQLAESGEALTGTIVEVYPQEGDTGICFACPGDFKNKPIRGLQFLWGLKEKEEGKWEGGYILDPKTGKVYRAKLTLKGDKLFVRGFIGFSALGRTQVWMR